MWFLVGFIAGMVTTGIIFWAYSENVGGNTVTEKVPAPTEAEAAQECDARIRALLERTSQALEYMEDRGYSSQRLLACDVMEFRREMGWVSQ